jgi:hypothetical protein
MYAGVLSSLIFKIFDEKFLYVSLSCVEIELQQCITPFGRQRQQAPPGQQYILFAQDYTSQNTV